jgi:mitochondrial fission protein ELM1
MVSEALATSATVEIFMVPLGRRHARFISSLFEAGLAWPFTGTPTPIAARAPVDATIEAARAVRNMLLWAD